MAAAWTLTVASMVSFKAAGLCRPFLDSAARRGRAQYGSTGRLPRGSVIGGESCLLSRSSIKRPFFTAPVASRLHLKKPTPTCFFTRAACRWRLIVGYARGSTTEQILKLQNDDLEPAFDASVGVTGALTPLTQGQVWRALTVEAISTSGILATETPAEPPG